MQLITIGFDVELAHVVVMTVNDHWGWSDLNEAVCWLYRQTEAHSVPLSVIVHIKAGTMPTQGLVEAMQRLWRPELNERFGATVFVLHPQQRALWALILDLFRRFNPTYTRYHLK
jgi:hypothetical protein